MKLHIGWRMGMSSLRGRVLYFTGLLTSGMGYPALACRALEDAATIEPDNPAFHYELGVARYKRHLFTEAETSFLRALELKPDMAQAHRGLGDIFRAQDKATEAIAQYEKAISLDPRLARAHLGIGIIRRRQFRLDEAAQSFRRAFELDLSLQEAADYLNEIVEFQKEWKDKVDKLMGMVLNKPDVPPSPRPLADALYMASAAGMRDWAKSRAREWVKADPGSEYAAYALAGLEGAATFPAPPDGYIETVFDDVANKFNKSLRNLSYQGPDLVVRMIAGYFPAYGLDILDAGCGTGLDAAALKPYARTLTGVDLSSKMLEIATERGLYDNLYKSDIVSFLKRHPGAYDLIAASDVFSYLGDLAGVIGAMAVSLRQGGRIVFTVEHDSNVSGNGWRLQGSGRYCHTEAYVHETVTAAGLALVAVETGLLRQELGQNVEALIVLARKET